MATDSNNDLNVVQEKLDKLGVRDVKFFFTPSARTMPNSVLKQDVAYLLSTYLDGYKVPLEMFGDTPK